MLKILVYPYALTRIIRGVAKPLLLSCLVVFLGFMFLSMKVEGTGGPLFAGLLKSTGQESLVLAISFIGFYGMIITAAGWVLSIILAQILSSLLLINAEDAVATVVSLRQTGATVNNVPVMSVTMNIDDGGQRREIRTNKLIDLGNMPRPGDRVRVAVSRVDPSCVRLLGA